MTAKIDVRKEGKRGDKKRDKTFPLTTAWVGNVSAHYFFSPVLKCDLTYNTSDNL